MSKKTTKVDLLTQKQLELNTYIGKANSAISVVTNTIDALGEINENIDIKIREIDEYIAGLTTTKTGLDDARSKNERIIKNFNALLNTD